MSLDLLTEFPGKVASDPVLYPQGKARDVTVSGDGLGTPWRAKLINDWLGYQQAVLVAAGEVPSGVPDNANESQYGSSLVKVLRQPAPATTITDDFTVPAQWDEESLFLIDNPVGAHTEIVLPTVGTNSGRRLRFQRIDYNLPDNIFTGDGASVKLLTESAGVLIAGAPGDQGYLLDPGQTFELVEHGGNWYQTGGYRQNRYWRQFSWRDDNLVPITADSTSYNVARFEGLNPTGQYKATVFLKGELDDITCMWGQGIIPSYNILPSDTVGFRPNNGQPSIDSVAFGYTEFLTTVNGCIGMEDAAHSRIQNPVSAAGRTNLVVVSALEEIANLTVEVQVDP